MSYSYSSTDLNSSWIAAALKRSIRPQWTSGCANTRSLQRREQSCEARSSPSQPLKLTRQARSLFLHSLLAFGRPVLNAVFDCVMLNADFSSTLVAVRVIVWRSCSHARERRRRTGSTLYRRITSDFRQTRAKTRVSSIDKLL